MDNIIYEAALMRDKKERFVACARMNDLPVTGYPGYA